MNGEIPETERNDYTNGHLEQEEKSKSRPKVIRSKDLLPTKAVAPPIRPIVGIAKRPVITPQIRKQPSPAPTSRSVEASPTLNDSNRSPLDYAVNGVTRSSPNSRPASPRLVISGSPVKMTRAADIPSSMPGGCIDIEMAVEEGIVISKSQPQVVESKQTSFPLSVSELQRKERLEAAERRQREATLAAAQRVESLMRDESHVPVDISSQKHLYKVEGQTFNTTAVPALSPKNDTHVIRTYARPPSPPKIPRQISPPQPRVIINPSPPPSTTNTTNNTTTSPANNTNSPSNTFTTNKTNTSTKTNNTDKTTQPAVTDTRPSAISHPPQSARYPFNTEKAYVDSDTDSDDEDERIKRKEMKERRRKAREDRERRKVNVPPFETYTVAEQIKCHTELHCRYTRIKMLRPELNLTEYNKELPLDVNWVQITTLEKFIDANDKSDGMLRYLVVFWCFAEIIMVNMGMVYMTGFAENQMEKRSRYHGMLMQMGTESSLANFTDNFSVTGKLMLTNLENFAFFIIGSYLCTILGPVAGGIIKNVLTNMFADSAAVPNSQQGDFDWMKTLANLTRVGSAAMAANRNAPQTQPAQQTKTAPQPPQASRHAYN